MAKVPKVLGETVAPKFLGVIEKPMPNGGKRQHNIYTFPKREACLMSKKRVRVQFVPPVGCRKCQSRLRPVEPNRLSFQPATAPQTRLKIQNQQ